MPKPILQSLILADHVYEDKLTGKRIIAGVFNRIIRGVKVLREVTPPTPQQPYHPPQNPQWHIPQTQPPPQQQPAPAQQPPPYQPNEPIQIHSGQSMPETAPAQPSYSPPTEANQPSAPAAPATAAPSPPPPSAPQPAPAATTPPAYSPAAAHPMQQQRPAEQAPTPQPEYTPPPTPPTPPMQPGQRVLEIPPTGLQSGSPFAYLSLTEVRGVTPMMLQLVNLQDDTQLFRSDLRVDCPNPLYTVELTVPLPPIAPPQAGIYALELLYNNELLGSLRIVVEDAA
jgi:hypothetical protein